MSQPERPAESLIVPSLEAREAARNICGPGYSIDVSGFAVIAYKLHALQDGLGDPSSAIWGARYIPDIQVSVVSPTEAEAAVDFLVPPEQQPPKWDSVFLGYTHEDYAGLIICAGGVATDGRTDNPSFGKNYSTMEREGLLAKLETAEGFRHVFREHVGKGIIPMMKIVFDKQRKTHPGPLPPGNTPKQRNALYMLQEQRQKAVLCREITCAIALGAMPALAAAAESRAA